jgi:rhomboid family GlyGly-CTERM serine protease
MALTAIKNRLSREGLSLYLLVLGCLLLGPWSPAWLDLFELDRGALQDGEYWRFVSGPLVHNSWEYLGVSIAGVVVLQQLFGRELNTVTWLWGYVLVALVTGVCMLAFSRFGSFNGLSAILHGLLAYGAILAMPRDGLLAWGVLLLVGAKVVWEQLQGGATLLQKFIDLPVAADAHLYGFAAGVVLGAVMVASARANNS